MKIMTFNIQHGVVFDDPEKRIDLPAFAEYINSEKPDILGINEIRGPKPCAPKQDINAYNAPQAQILASLTGMNYFFAPAIESGEHGLYGNALLSRYEIGKSEVFPIPSPPVEMRYFSRYESRCLLKSLVNTDEGEVSVFVCHMGLNPQERLAAVETVCRELDRTEGKKILMGDFNMAPDNELLAPIFERLADTSVMIGGDKSTFPSNAPSVKIDYVFVSRDIEVVSAEIPSKYISDHKIHTAIVK